MARASMRPRVFPAEDGEAGRPEDGAGEASMRPRVFPAEDAREPAWMRQQRLASMRPRVFPAEDSALTGANAGDVATLQ